MEKVNTEVIFVGNNVNQWLVKEYIVSEHRGDWQCSCAIKYKRNPKLNCKHIDIVRNFLLSPEERLKLEQRYQVRILLEKFKRINSFKCGHHHIFKLVKEKGRIFYHCDKCENDLEVWEYREYRKRENLS